MPPRRYRFQRIESATGCREFKRRYEASVRERSRGRIETSVEETYLERAQVTGLYDARGQLVGGYVINHAPPLLVLGPLPPEIREAWLAEHPERTQCELVAIWKSPTISQAVAALILWPRIIRDCALSGRRHILGLGYDNRMNDIYRIVRPTQIYAGLRADKPELRQHVCIYAYTPLSITATYCANLVSELLLAPLRERLG